MVSLGLQAGGTMRLLSTWILRTGSGQGLSHLVPRGTAMGCWGRRGQVPRPGWEEGGTTFCSLPSGPQTLLHLGKDIFQGPLISILIWIL